MLLYVAVLCGEGWVQGKVARVQVCVLLPGGHAALEEVGRAGGWAWRRWGGRHVREGEGASWSCCRRGCCHWVRMGGAGAGATTTVEGVAAAGIIIAPTGASGEGPCQMEGVCAGA
eukprot:919118-Pelagomonas_calceolata.AAC.10